MIPVDNFNMNTKRTKEKDNVVIMSDAGKLIFSRYGDEASLCSICGLIQTLRASTLNDPNLHNGDIESINTSTTKICFMQVGSMTLMAISYKDGIGEIAGRETKDITTLYNTDPGSRSSFSCHTEDFLRLQLEILYSAIIFTLTDSVLYMLDDDPNLDVAYMLGSTSTTLRRLVDEMAMDHGDIFTHGIKTNFECAHDENDWENNVDDSSLSSSPVSDRSEGLDFHSENRSSCWLGGVDVISPIPLEIRNSTSKVLATECSKKNSVIYAILSYNRKLFNIIQPHSTEHQLSSFDLNLILHFVNAQTALPGNELWFPICLPRLSSSGFVHCYSCSIGIGGLSLTLISQEPSIEEFRELQDIANKIRCEMGGEIDEDKVLRIFKLSDEQLSGDDGLIWERGDSNLVSDDEKTVEVSDDELWKKRFGVYLLHFLKKASNFKTQIQSYCDMASLAHFSFRYWTHIRHCDSGVNSGGRLSQLFGPPLSIVSSCGLSERKVWQMYQRLSLKLRLDDEDFIDGSSALYDQCKLEACGQDMYNSQFRPSQIFHEGKTSINRFLTMNDHDGVYVAFQGDHYEFIGVASSELISSTDDIRILCTTLVETLLCKTDDLFIEEPLSFL